jgi:hypothetical protein
MLNYTMILDTITKDGTQQDQGRSIMNPVGRDGQVTASLRRSFAALSSNRLNPGGGQVDAGTIDSPATYTQSVRNRAYRIA